MSEFLKELLREIRQTVAEVRASDMNLKAKIVCLAALHTLGWLSVMHPAIARDSMRDVLIALGSPPEED